MKTKTLLLIVFSLALWLLSFEYSNAQGINSTRYVASSVITQGSHEIKIFNNLYTQKASTRSTFYTMLINYLYGSGSRINVGVDARIRAVANGPASSSALSVFGSKDDDIVHRSGLTAIGPKIRWAPSSKWNNFSIQSSFLLPVGSDLSGNDEQPYIDWDTPTWTIQFVNDFTLGNSFSLYAEVGFIWEEIGQESKGRTNQTSVPVTSILSYFLTPDWVFYALGNYAPFIQQESDYFYQYGLGSKYRVRNNFEIEFLVTDFSRKILSDANGTASTYNMGIRYSIW
ncbi:MAG: hypothetical protein KJP00_06360 [Bacteroidia bacterium]|nr:hypothetical protein [Bacteroidia bacterium]